MVLTKAECLNRISVLPGSITLVAIPSVLGKFFMKLPHMIIPVCFGKYTGRGYGGIGSISIYKTAVRNFVVQCEPVTVNQQKPWPFFQLIKGKVHGLEGSAQDIYSVNLFLVNHGYGVVQRMDLYKSTQRV